MGRKTDKQRAAANREAGKGNKPLPFQKLPKKDPSLILDPSYIPEPEPNNNKPDTTSQAPSLGSQKRGGKRKNFDSDLDLANENPKKVSRTTEWRMNHGKTAIARRTNGNFQQRIGSIFKSVPNARKVALAVRRESEEPDSDIESAPVESTNDDDVEMFDAEDLSPLMSTEPAISTSPVPAGSIEAASTESTGAARMMPTPPAVSLPKDTEIELKAQHARLQKIIKKNRSDLTKKLTILTDANAAGSVLDLEALAQFNDKWLGLSLNRLRLDAAEDVEPPSLDEIDEADEAWGETSRDPGRSRAPAPKAPKKTAASNKVVAKKGKAKKGKSKAGTSADPEAPKQGRTYAENDWVPPPPPAPYTAYQIPSFDARRIIYPGANHDPWWDMPQLIAQVKDAIKIFDVKYPDGVAVFIFDCSSAHEAFSSDALLAHKMNRGPGGKQPKMRDTTIPSTGQPQHMNFAHDYRGNDSDGASLAGQPKGMEQVLRERGLLQALEVKHRKVLGVCAKCKLSQAAREKAMKAAKSKDDEAEGTGFREYTDGTFPCAQKLVPESLDLVSTDNISKTNIHSGLQGSSRQIKIHQANKVVYPFHSWVHTQMKREKKWIAIDYCYM
ncbi:hypothetical protein C8J57DRAFT_1213936 [Mycena rebaudengoi]|nr:hypothetical protein C8J57DRAFT_1213936 [Mycena rebaudengoi]